MVVAMVWPGWRSWELTRVLLGERLALGRSGGWRTTTYDGVLGLDADEGVVEHGAEVGVLGGADAGEVVDEGGVEEAEFVVHVLEPLLEGLEFGVPVFADEE
jgi:hypothetical protein